ncbi:MAG: phenylacetate--CoA ligase family protein [Elusimicrobia bacterium]|nr:phenylacetate--CoA ligase family protein [Elusimicrobiota bacterium]MDE2314302.1 phenylacetate--CoA ligase family protein [Elusimicrobiota bacterium]
MAPFKLSVAALVAYARERSPFYRKLYRSLPEKTASLASLPVVRQEDFWRANSYRGNRLLTGPLQDGVLLRSGGTTGKPKFSVFSRDEWSEFSSYFARKLALNGLKNGDRVANLFYSGALYGSFLFTHKVLEECPVRTLQLPITGTTPLPDMISLLKEHGASVLTGLPSTIAALAGRLKARGLSLPKVRLILFAGEPMQPDQRLLVLAAFPKTGIRSIGYASNDAGMLGYADPSCGPNEFRACDGHSIYEILDEETGRPISEPDCEGLSVATALARRLMPIIRYPVGDRALWLEPVGTPNRKYRLLGRSEESARVASLSVGFDEGAKAVRQTVPQSGSVQLQMIVEHRGGKDGLILRVAARVSPKREERLARRIIQTLYGRQPMLRRFVHEGKIRAPRVEWRDPGTLEANPRTGKLRRIIDLRARRS